MVRLLRVLSWRTLAFGPAGPLRGQKTIVTGASSGIRAASARRFTSAGATVGVNFRGHREAPRKLRTHDGTDAIKVGGFPPWPRHQLKCRANRPGLVNKLELPGPTSVRLLMVSLRGMAYGSVRGKSCCPPRLFAWSRQSRLRAARR
jgi:hypothetical protein